MYRQRKRDLNLKPNRQLDKRSSRGMIYENEELRMRTIAICEDVDRGQSDIKKLRKENDHLKREIWGLRDECENLEKMLKKVCISANIPEITLDSSSKNDESDDDFEEDDERDSTSDGDGEEEGSSHKKSRRKRRGSGSSIRTFDSEVGSCINTMFGQDGEEKQEEIGFADEDPGSVIMAPLAYPEVEPVAGPSSAITMLQGSGSDVYHTHTPWSHHAAIPPDLEDVREESESAVQSPVTSPPSPTAQLQLLLMKSDKEVNVNDSLPDPTLVILPTEQSEVPVEGRKTPVIQITPASSPNSNSTSSTGNGEAGTVPVESDASHGVEESSEAIQTYGCITVVPKTFKVTSEILVGKEANGNNIKVSPSTVPSNNPFMEGMPPKSILTKKPDSDPSISVRPPEQIIWGGTVPPGGGGHLNHRRSCYFPSASNTMPQQSPYPSHSHRGLGMLAGYCCCNNDFILGGYQSEPSLNSTGLLPPDFVSTEEPHSLNFFNAFCCRPAASQTPPVTMRSVWNTVDKNIVIGFYGFSTQGGGGSVGLPSEERLGEPKVQEIIDELESQFDPTLENILGIRLIPGRIFISLKNASVVKAFLQHFKNDLILQRKQRKIRIHFIEGATAKLSTTLVLSGIPPELPDLAVISALNQFGQVVAPLERRNYKGIDISERIAKMHLVIKENSIPELVNVSGYEVRIRVEHQNQNQTKCEVEQESNKTKQQQQQHRGDLRQQQLQPQQQQQKYGFVTPTTPTPTTTSGGPSAHAGGLLLKPHKPVTRSSSSAPRLETPAPGQLTNPPFPSVEQRRQASVCVGNIPADQHPSKLAELQLGKASMLQAQKVSQAQSEDKMASQQQTQTQTSSTPCLPPPPLGKKPLARLLVSSPGSFSPTSPLGSPQGDPFGNMTPPQSQGGFKGFCRSFDPRRGSAYEKAHAPLTPSSSYSPRTRRKSSVQFASHGGKGKREPLPWCGCWGLGCG